MITVTGDTALLLAERGLRLAIGFATSIWVARTLGPADFGLYNYALAFIVLFSWLSSLGLEPILVRELTRNPQQARQILASAFLLRLGAATVTVLACVAAAAILGSRLATALVFVLSLATLFQAFAVVEAWLQAELRFRAAIGVRITVFAIASASRVLAAQTAQPLLALAAVSVLEAALLATLWLLVLRRTGPEIGHYRFSQATVSQLFTATAPLMMSGLAIAIYTRIDVVMLGTLRSQEEAGLYAAATTISEAFYAIPVAIMGALAPRLARLMVADPARYAHELQRGLRLNSALGFACALAVTALGPWAITAFYGADYEPAGIALQIHIWSTWFVFVSTASEPWFINGNYQRYYFFKTVTAAASNVALNLALIPPYGAAGAAFATLVSYSLSAVWCNVIWRATRPLFRYQLSSLLPLWPSRTS